MPPDATLADSLRAAYRERPGSFDDRDLFRALELTGPAWWRNDDGDIPFVVAYLVHGPTSVRFAVAREGGLDGAVDASFFDPNGEPIGYPPLTI